MSDLILCENEPFCNSSLIDLLIDAFKLMISNKISLNFAAFVLIVDNCYYSTIIIPHFVVAFVALRTLAILALLVEVASF